jgi:hypothetical protein
MSLIIFSPKRLLACMPYAYTRPAAVSLSLSLSL